jgi:hypothetical protein
MVTAMNAFSLEDHFPKLMQGVSRGLNKYGDKLLFSAVAGTSPITVNPSADTGIHTAVPHRYLYAYLTAIKSFLRYYADIAVYVHDDGSLLEEDKELIRKHVPGARIIDRAWADQIFADKIGDEFLMKVRKSYTSYLKLFDPTLVSTNKRIIIVDTDVLFLNHPKAIIHWAQSGGAPWFHRSGSWRRKDPNQESAQSSPQPTAATQPKHIQHMVVERIDEINQALQRQFAFEHGFNSGFIGYDNGTVDYSQLKELLTHLYGILGDRIFRWGSEQTMHGLILCGKGAVALPSDEYMVFTNLNSEKAAQAIFVHFIGEFRYHRMLYPRLASKVIRELKQ